MSGYLGDLSPSQEQALKEIRNIFSDELNDRQDDHFLLQFLRARRFDIKKTEEMLRRHLQFRKEFPEEYFLNEYKIPEFLEKYILPPLAGYDKEGCPVRIIHVGHQDIKGLLQCIHRKEIRKMITWFLDTDKEGMRQRSKETGTHIEKRTFIFDLDGLSFQQIYHKDVYHLVISFIKLYECNYPENLKVAFVINTPSFFSWLFNIVKSMLSDDTVKKLKIHGHSGWKDALLECIDAEVLPVIYGGKRTDPDGNPNCPSLIRVWNPIPKEFYLRNLNSLDPNDPKVQKVIVHRRSRVRIPLEVEKESSTLLWEVDVRATDVRVGLSWSTGNEEEIVMDSVLVSSEFGAEKGCFLAEKVGTYNLILDNSYSLFRSKAVFYKYYISTATANGNNGIITYDEENNTGSSS